MLHIFLFLFLFMIMIIIYLNKNYLRGWFEFSEIVFLLDMC